MYILTETGYQRLQYTTSGMVNTGEQWQAAGELIEIIYSLILCVIYI